MIGATAPTPRRIMTTVLIGVPRTAGAGPMINGEPVTIPEMDCGPTERDCGPPPPA